MAHLHALVVDDSPSMRKQVCYALARIDGMATSEAADGAEGDSYARELNDQVGAMVKELDALEIASFLTGQFDRNHAIFSQMHGRKH